MDKPANTLWPIDPVGIATVNSKLKQNISIIYLSFLYTYRSEKLKLKLSKNLKKVLLW